MQESLVTLGEPSWATRACCRRDLLELVAVRAAVEWLALVVHMTHPAMKASYVSPPTPVQRACIGEDQAGNLAARTARIRISARR
jgi:hypothetical protein